MRLIAGLHRVRDELEGPLNTMPMLVGPSRKGFLGKLTGEGLLIQAAFYKCIQRCLRHPVTVGERSLLEGVYCQSQGTHRQRIGTSPQQPRLRYVQSMEQALCGHTMWLQ